jgi:hypothetical protein
VVAKPELDPELVLAGRQVGEAVTAIRLGHGDDWTPVLISVAVTVDPGSTACDSSTTMLHRAFCWAAR